MPRASEKATPTLLVDVNATATWQTALPGLNALIKKSCLETLHYCKWPAGTVAELSVLLTTDAKIKTLNHNWRGKNKPTNVLSFPQVQHYTRLKSPTAHVGDIVMAYQTIKREAKAQKKPLKAHVAHLVVHGMLHLLGYDHETNTRDAQKMERAEINILANLGYENPYISYDH